MMTRNFKQTSAPVKNQEISIEYKGRIYAICSEEQMAFLLMSEKEKIMMLDAEKVYRKEKKPMNDADLKVQLEAYAGSCGFATLPYVLGLMTPAEQEEWKNKYRFTPISKCRR